MELAAAASPKPGKIVHKSASPGKTPKPGGHWKHMPLLRDFVMVSGVAFQ